MIDVHFHCLPGIDDGPADWDQAVALCRAAADEGTTTIVATPHVLRGAWLNEDRRARRALVDELNAKLGGSPRVVEGCEYFFSGDAVELWELGDEGPLTAINNGTCLLVEFPATILPSSAEAVLFELALKGVRPLIAHPERNLVLAVEPEKLRRFIDLGALAQITAGSILGRFGPAAARAATEMLKLELVTVVASDAHSPRRPPEMRAARERVTKQFGAAVAERLFEVNPGELLLTTATPRS